MTYLDKQLKLKYIVTKLKQMIQEESTASKEYERLALVSTNYGYGNVAMKLREISAEESTHRDKLNKLLKETER